MRKWFTCFIGGCCSLLFCAVTAFGHNLRVTGVVTDARACETLFDVSVLVKATRTGAKTNVNGNYAINTTSNSVLVCSYIGYTPREVPINNQTTVNVSFQGTATQLQQVVDGVTAYNGVGMLTAPFPECRVKRERAEVAFRIHGKTWNATRSLFPIPQQQIDLSGWKLSQNPVISSNILIINNKQL